MEGTLTIKKIQPFMIMNKLVISAIKTKVSWAFILICIMQTISVTLDMIIQIDKCLTQIK